ncbi:MAG: response regulator [Betaproteobacteria bacterium]
MNAPPPAAAAARPRVVFVDDDATIRRFVAMALEDLPVDVVTCADAGAARAALREAPAALLLTDLMMPGEDGFALLASVVADPALRAGARLALFSAGLNATTRSRLQSLDVWRELGKPVSTGELLDCVAGASGLLPGVQTPVASALGAAEQQVVDRQFGGDAALYLAFREEALRQFEADGLALARAVEAADWPALRRQAHSLKGALATLGDDDGAALARQLEAGAARDDGAACRAAWPALRRHLESLSRGRGSGPAA